MKKAFIISIFILWSFPLWASSQQSPTGDVFSLSGGFTQGSMFFQNTLSTTSGFVGQLTLGTRPFAALELALTGKYDSQVLSANSSTLGRLNMTDMGGSLKIFFLDPIFIEAAGGEIQGNFYYIPTQTNFIASGYFYNIGSGADIKLGSGVFFESGVFIRTILFSQTEFKTLTDFYVNAGIGFYF